MKRTISILLVSFIICNNNLVAQSEWLIRDGTGFFFVATIEVRENTLTGQTRKNALKDYVGQFKFSVARALTPLKYPEIIHFRAAFIDATKTKFTGTYHRLTSEKKMEGDISPDSISIKLTSKNKVEILKGVRRSSTTATKDYPSVVARMVSLTEQKIYDPKIIESKKWKNFRTTMIANSKKMKDDLELLVGSFAMTRSFPFSHYSLTKHTNKKEVESVSFSLVEINNKTCVLDINAFSGKSATMDSLINIIDTKRYENIIVDLRDNPGGDAESAIPLMAFISQKETTVGVFPNNKWYKENNRFPLSSEYERFNEFNAGTLNEFYIQSETGYGTYIKCLPSKKHFDGKVFVLINKNTGSTSEVVALALKENKLAVLIGQKTAGGVLSAKKFSINEDFDLVIPQNDYISYAGYRIDKNGVRPDIEVEQDEIGYVLNTLLKLKIDR